MFRFVRTKLILLAVVFVPLLVPASTFAANPFAGIDCSKAADSAVCQTNATNDPLAGQNGVIVRATNIFAFIAGFTAVIFLVLAGIKYITSTGDPAEISKAKQSIIYALIGLVFIAIARSVIGYIINRV